jgi:hypothetical protein
LGAEKNKRRKRLKKYSSENKESFLSFLFAIRPDLYSYISKSKQKSSEELLGMMNMKEL